MRNNWNILLIICCMLALSACSSNDDILLPNEGDVGQAAVTLLVTPNGLGDNGYIDSAAEALFAFAFQTATTIHLLMPEDEGEAEMLYNEWLTNNADQDSAVLIVGSEVYGDFVERTPVELTGKGTRILLYESTITEQPDGVSSIFINRYGAAYLSGAMSGMLNAFIIAAAPGYNTLEDAINGFKDGYAAHHDDGKTVELTYLAEGEQGFAIPDSAYHLLTRRMEDFFFYNEMVFPLLGGSGIGSLRCMNDDDVNLGLIIGMDVDQSAVSPRVPFSMVINIGEALRRYLDDWLEGKPWPKHQTLGLGEGGTDVILSPTFYQTKKLMLESYSNPNTFIERYNAYKDEAIRKEVEYYDN